MRTTFPHLPGVYRSLWFSKLAAPSCFVHTPNAFLDPYHFFPYHFLLWFWDHAERVGFLGPHRKGRLGMAVLRWTSMSNIGLR